MLVYRFFAVEMSRTVIVDGSGWIGSDRDKGSVELCNIHVVPWLL